MTQYILLTTAALIAGSCNSGGDQVVTADTGVDTSTNSDGDVDGDTNTAWLIGSDEDGQATGEFMNLLSADKGILRASQGPIDSCALIKIERCFSPGMILTSESARTD
jgi:hypothetical protein